MNFELDFKIHVDDAELDSATLLASVDEQRDQLTVPGAILGDIVVRIDDNEQALDFSEPIVRLVAQWVRKLAWVVGGDTETVALRNSEHCFAFVPAGDSVEFSLFEGSETEIEDYLVEPTNIRLEKFANASIELAERVVALLKAVDATLLDTDEDCRDLLTSLDEGRSAWHDHQLHQRR